jgi:hypothetical protein
VVQLGLRFAARVREIPGSNPGDPILFVSAGGDGGFEIVICSVEGFYEFRVFLAGIDTLFGGNLVVFRIFLGFLLFEEGFSSSNV